MYTSTGGEADEAEEVKFSYEDTSHNFFQRCAFRAIEPLTGQRQLKRLYLDYQAEEHPHHEFFDAALDRLEIKVLFDPDRRDRIPAKGPLVVVANHPFGVVDGLILGQLVQAVRDDFLILLHGVLYQAPELRPFSLPIDFSGAPEAVATNLETRGRARQHLRNGGAIIVFPGGTVSTAKHLLDFSPARDPDWQPFTSHLIRQARATVVPVFFAGENSRLFHTVSQFSATLRLALLFNEVRRQMRQAVSVTVGEPIPFDALEGIKNRTALAAHLKQQTYALARQDLS